ncbi:hypothetical protein JB92DRAFT_3083700 [Gautieria morchelliformis]|nr:hypothetical protein JB92DRAFT_3083700 [Gautieria morchelliformis]
MDPSKFASTFAPYVRASSSLPKSKRPWFSTLPASSSYQSGAVPTFSSSAMGGIGAMEEIDTAAQMWETRFHWRVDVCAAVTYLGGPITALLFLILETSNDYIRFHAYQSALLTSPLLLLRILASFIFPSWLQTTITIMLLISAVGMGIRAYRDATQNALSRYELPYIGEMADRWVGEE